jgi:hypothetical protein
MAAVLGAFALGLAALALWALAIGDVIPGLAFGAMAAMLGTGIFVLLRVKSRDMTPAEREALRERRDRARMHASDHGGVDWSSGSGGSSDATSTSSSGDSGSSGDTDTGRSG